MESLIQIGSEHVDSESISELADAIIRVATCSPFDNVCEKALDIFDKKVQTHVRFDNCLIENRPQGVPTRGSNWSPSAGGGMSVGGGSAGSAY